MFKFYYRRLWSAVSEWHGMSAKVAVVVTGALAIVGYFNPELAKQSSQAWHGASRWWSALPIGVLVLYRILRANYLEFAALEQRLKAKLPEFRPRVLPVDYAKAEKDPSCGLYVRNPGYDALDVEIPSVRIGKSGYILVFPHRMAQFGERSGTAFFAGWLESVEQGVLPGRDGCALHEIMSAADVASLNFAITYKDTDFRCYKTHCMIQRTDRSRNGLEVKAISQEMVNC